MKAVYVVKFRAGEKNHTCEGVFTVTEEEFKKNDTTPSLLHENRAGEVVREYKKKMGITDPTVPNSVEYTVYYSDQ